MGEILLQILMIGDIVGSSGRKFLSEQLPSIKKKYSVDFCIANGENAAAGLGLTPRLANEIGEFGVDLITLGNHAWSRREMVERIDTLSHVIRPANGPDSWPGQGWKAITTPLGTVVVINLLGRIFMDPIHDPFTTADRILETIKSNLKPAAIVVDFHAEATAEKMAMAHYLNGQVSLVVGTHTHVQTADEQILNGGTGYITDVGMTGPFEGIIGMDPASSLRRLVHHLPAPYEAANGRGQLSAVLVTTAPSSIKCQKIERILIRE